MKQLNRDVNEVSNTIAVEGILAEKNLELSTYVKDGKTVECIRGDVTIKTGDTNFVKLKVFSNKLKSDGSEGKAYKAMVTVMNEHKSIAEVGEENADKVNALGKLNPRKPYKAQDGKIIVGNEYACNFMSRIKDESKYDPSATLTIEGLVMNYKVETKLIDNEPTETGRIIAGICTPVYGGIAVYDAILEGDDCIEFFEDNITKGKTVPLTIDLVSRVEKSEKKSSGGGFGKKPSDRTFTRVTNEMVVIGADEPYDDFDAEVEGEQKAFDPQAIKDLLTERENKIKSVENDEAKPAPKQEVKKGFGSRPSNTNPAVNAYLQQEDMSDELPF